MTMVDVRYIDIACIAHAAKCILLMHAGYVPYARSDGGGIPKFPLHTYVRKNNSILQPSEGVVIPCDHYSVLDLKQHKLEILLRSRNTCSSICRLANSTTLSIQLQELELQFQIYTSTPQWTLVILNHHLFPPRKVMPMSEKVQRLPVA